ncbi:A24 family peptidase [Vibrio paucivorans]|uniref:Prepilin peptidase n=1 Tax=Vibrio paucivorans TaxID=2829489 RepID=A0A9X3CF55_9VIBR|nr:prepilin peptidase [Vibrio paucivorans]MCW8334560.1 prepilin peptidase [Vibrio paucivorans]
MHFLIWLGFVIVAVYDARENRIPNVMLLGILIFSFIFKALSTSPLSLIMWSLIAGCVFFFAALALYFIRMMAPGDVKLLGVVGFELGWGNLLEATYWIAVFSVVIGLFYALARTTDLHHSSRELFSKYFMVFSYGPLAGKAISSTVNNKNSKLRMPFAPVVVIGLAMQQYF